ncbi:thiamine transporter substrate binding subunit [Streptosporangium jomthongense]|uniref:Thiamine-binding periplasmic protein n=1 Tax=Marinobacter aromaticivorans TaxID=1494078 RepID=A0ABW2IWS3_9GAMM|nr:thiamine ABC transporter substrate binding subunit [Marinobacter aromaticivorans]GGE69947.1 thiamine transporter substrate binding subunit [Streptosporangium jomthongense]
MLIRAFTLGLLALASASAMAQQTPALTIYTHPSFAAEWGPGPAVKEAFEQTCNCTINYVVLDSGGDILQRLRLEGKSTQADLVLGLDTGTMETSRQTGLLGNHKTDLSPLDLPINWQDPVFVPYDWGYFAFVYDTEQLPNPPASLAALIAAPDDLKIIIQDPRTSTPGLGLLLWMRHVYGDRAPEKWQQLKGKILTTTKSWSDGYFSLFMNGEAPMILSYSTSPAYHMAMDNTDRYQAAEFEEGHYLQVEVAALVASSAQKELAREFLEFMLTPGFQRHIPLKNVMYPAIDLGDELPDVFNHLIQPPEARYFEPETVTNNRRQWLNEWLDAMTR